MRATQTNKSLDLLDLLELAGCVQLFKLGQIFTTPKALKIIEDSTQSPIFFLARHTAGDWIECSKENEEINKNAIATGGEICSEFESGLSERLLVITNRERSTTKMVLASEY